MLKLSFMEAKSIFRNYVFISYNHKDVKWAKWLQKKLEWYRLPTEIHNEFSDSRYIRPVFRDRDNLTSGVLNDELRNHLVASKYLVVLCSPNSAQSEWVSDEIQAFIDMGRIDKIVPFIIKGDPNDYRHSDITQPLMDECFPLALRKWNLEHPNQNLLGIAVTDDGKTDRQKAFVRLVAHLLGVEFDVLWQRHKRYVRRLISMLALFSVVAILLAYWLMIPIQVSISIQDERCQLPEMEYGLLTVNGSKYSFSNPDTIIDICPLPGYYRLRKIPIRFHANRFYSDEHESLTIGLGVRQNETLQLHRDSTFSVFAGTIYDGSFNDFSNHPVEKAQVTVGSHHAYSDANGQFRIVIPIEEQEEFKPVTIMKSGFRIFHREDESPNHHLTYLIFKK